MYFLSALDPNYRIKGSRDPLGFQSLWAAAGHQIVKHLSTVSSSLRDFMILCYAIHFYGNRDPKGFIKFFLKYEQLNAYARRIINNETSFNGVEFINKKVTDSHFYISSKDTILSNQRAYGIYGKYIRPLRDMGIIEDPKFHTVMEDSLSKSDNRAISKLIEPLFEGNDLRLKINKTDLMPIAEMLKTLTETERQLYREYILKIPDIDHPQNKLYDVIRNNQHIARSPFQLHQIIQLILSTKEINETLKFALINIENTDRVLHPLNKVFTNLLTKSIWTNEEILNEQLFENLPGSVSCNFRDDTMIRLNGLLELSPIELVHGIVERNAEVSKLRGNKAWIEEDKKTFKVLYGENGQKITEINTETGYEFSYFLNNYLYLFRQIEMT
jgi:hypothetical protein